MLAPTAPTPDNPLEGCKRFYLSSVGDGNQLTTVLALDMDKEQPAQATTIVSRPGAVYASDRALYIAVPRDRWSSPSWFEGTQATQASAVHKLGLDGPRVRYLASGLIKGRVLNQFSLDEREGYLRVATSTGRAGEPGVHSTLTVLEQQGSELDEVGRVDELAPDEDIRSVRFDGERAFVVTFKQTDPLFVFDLKHPRAPRLLAELKIPGFSTYMHMMDADHLLTIGYDADEWGAFGGVSLQIFDVSDMSRPFRAHKHVIGTRGSMSAGLTNHLAFNYFGALDLLALPMTLCEGTFDITFSGLLLFDTTAQAGFKLRGEVSHPPGPNIDCSDWWTEATSQVERSIVYSTGVAGESYVFSVSHSLVKVNRLLDPSGMSGDLATVPLRSIPP